jgi:hypothetical protein
MSDPINDIRMLALEVAGNTSKDWDIPFVRRMEESVVEYRATILKQEYDKNGRFPSGNEDTVTIEIINVPPAECLDDSITCEVRRTKYRVPKPIRKNRTPTPFNFVGSTNQEYPFMFTRPEEVKSFLRGTKFIKAKALYAYYNDYVYIFNYEGSKITIRSVFSDPRQLLELLDCDKKPCKVDILLDGDMKRTIKMMVYEELRQFNKLPEDQTVRLTDDKQ